MIPHKTAYIFFTVRRTFFNYFKSSKQSADSLTNPPPSYAASDSSSPPNTVSNVSLRRPIIDPKINGQHYDLAIIGGGSAGLALATVNI